MIKTKPGSLCQFLIHAIVALALLAPAGAFADVVYTTLPGNFSSGAAGLGDSRYSGFAFRTPAGQPYAIDSVRLNLWNNTNVPDPQFVVELYDDNAGDPGSLVATIGTGTMDPTYDVLEVATPAAPVVLAADTVYWIMAYSPGNGTASVSWFGGGGSPAGSTFPHVRGPVLWTPSSYLEDITSVGNLHVEINASLAAATPTYTVGGSITGLNGNVTLQNNGGDDLAAGADGSFTFVTELADGAAYAVTVSTQPTGQTCSVTNGSGVIAGADVTNVAVTCVTDVIPTYSVGGTVSGLTGTGLALQNNGVDTLAISADGPFTFLTELVDTTAYAVTVSAQPTGQTCSITDGSGMIATADVTNVSVACIDDVVVPPPVPMVPIPAMSKWALILLTMLLGLMVFANRRRLF